MKYQYFSVKIYFVQPLMQSVALTVLWFPLVVCKGTLVVFFFCLLCLWFSNDSKEPVVVLLLCLK